MNGKNDFITNVQFAKFDLAKPSLMEKNLAPVICLDKSITLRPLNYNYLAFDHDDTNSTIGAHY